MKPVLRYLGVFLAWNLAVSATIVLLPQLGVPAAVTIPLALALSAWLLWGWVLRERGGRGRRRATLRLRPLTPATLRWTLAATPVLLVLAWAVQEVYLRLVPVPSGSLQPFQGIMESAGGRLSIAVLAVAVAPVIEEFVFRGLIQRTLERRWGALAGIAGSAALFAAVHVLPWVFPLHFFLGLAFGFAVWASRSIWSGVLLHAANNTVALIGLLVGGAEPTPTPTLWEIGLDPAAWEAFALLALCVPLAVWAGRGLRRAGRDADLRYAGARGWPAPEPR